MKLKRPIVNNFHSIATLAFLAVIILSGIAHGWNMFDFPYYENDEGVYMSQAWSFINEGKLAPYTYWYDHAPLGWLFIATWVILTGGFYTFGFSINSGRVFMLVLQLCSTLLVMLITKKFTRSNFAAVLAGVFFSLSPIGLYFHRRVLLDNIMTFWFLASYFMILKDKIKLSDIILSALFFGLAVLTKENAIFFIPGTLVLVYQVAHVYHRNLALLKWLLIMCLVVSWYFLYAHLKGELFASGTWLGGPNDHVSLIETLKYQSSRKGGSIFDFQNSTFWKNVFLWIRQDPAVLIVGTFSNIALLLVSIRKKMRVYLSLGLLGLFFIFFLTRGGIVLEFYIVPLLPILCISLAIVIAELMRYFSKWVNLQSQIVYLAVVISTVFGYVIFAQTSRAFGQNSAGHKTFVSNQASAQRVAVDWIRSNVDQEAMIVIDNYMYLDLKDPNNPSHKVYPNAEWYWKVDQDKEIKHDLLNNSYKNIDLITYTPQMGIDLSAGASQLTSEALENSNLWRRFDADSWGVELWHPMNEVHILQRAWRSYKKRYIFNGRVIDPREQVTTSEGQSYALLKAVLQDDKNEFDSVLSWTNGNLLNRQGLFSWKYGKDEDGNLAILDVSSASDADQDIALALLFAFKQWNDERYLLQARSILNSIWKHEVKVQNKKSYLLPGPWAKEKDGVLVNPSYFAPYAYRIFAEVDRNHDWNSVIDTSYEIVELCSEANLDTRVSVGLPPEWCQISTSGNALAPIGDGISATQYSYNAFRTPWRIALDYKWYGEKRAMKYLQSLSFLEKEWSENNKIFVAYSHDGKVWENYESVASYAMNLSIFSVIDNKASNDIYKTKILPQFYEDSEKSYWQDPNNYYTQNMAWFGVALYSGQLSNLWE